MQPSPKHADYLDSLVEKFIIPNPENPNMASTTDREEISSIFLEVVTWNSLSFAYYYDRK